MRLTDEEQSKLIHSLSDTIVNQGDEINRLAAEVERQRIEIDLQFELIEKLQINLAQMTAQRDAWREDAHELASNLRRYSQNDGWAVMAITAHHALVASTTESEAK